MISRHDYLAFGDEVTNTVGNVAGRTTAQGYGNDDDIRKQYTGYERDKESGLDYAQARYYNSNHGRFTSVAPLTASGDIKNPQTFNRYSYVLNSPYKFVDPLGLVSQNTAACGSSCSNRGASSMTAFGVGLNSTAGQTIEIGSIDKLSNQRVDVQALLDSFQDTLEGNTQWLENQQNNNLRYTCPRCGVRPSTRGRRYDARGRRRDRRTGKTWDQSTGRSPRRRKRIVFYNLRDHARRHSNYTVRFYLNHAINHTRRHHWSGTVRRKGIGNRRYYVSLLSSPYGHGGTNMYLLTSTGSNGRTIFTHMQTNYNNLRNNGITLPANMRPINPNVIGPHSFPSPIRGLWRNSPRQ